MQIVNPSERKVQLNVENKCLYVLRGGKGNHLTFLPGPHSRATGV